MHTRGPWRYIKEDNVIISIDTNRLIDLIPRSTNVTEDERNSNGYLVAAAPDLLEACEKVIKSLEGRVHSHNALLAVGACVQAIAKAKGEV